MLQQIICALRNLNLHVKQIFFKIYLAILIPEYFRLYSQSMTCNKITINIISEQCNFQPFIIMLQMSLKWKGFADETFKLKCFNFAFELGVAL